MKTWNCVHSLEESVALFSRPDERSAIVQQLSPGTDFHLCDYNPAWCEARLPNSSNNGFIKGNTKAFFKLSCVLHGGNNTLYKDTEPSSEVLRLLKQGESVVLSAMVVKVGMQWIKTTTKKGEEGYLDHIPMTSGSERLTIKEKAWTCHKCFKINPDKKRTCQSCGSAVPSQYIIPKQSSRILSIMANIAVLLYFCVGIGIFGGVVAAARQSIHLPWLEGVKRIGFVVIIAFIYVIIGVLVIPPLLRVYEAGQPKSKGD